MATMNGNLAIGTMVCDTNKPHYRRYGVIVERSPRTDTARYRVHWTRGVVTATKAERAENVRTWVRADRLLVCPTPMDPLDPKPTEANILAGESEETFPPNATPAGEQVYQKQNRERKSH